MTERILKAAWFAASALDMQTRGSAIRELRIVHALTVAQHVAKHCPDQEDTIIAALLHDVIRDTDKTPDDILKEFGPDVQRLVVEVSTNEHGAAKRAAQIAAMPKLSSQAKIVVTADLIEGLNKRGYTTSQSFASQLNYCHLAGQFAKTSDIDSICPNLAADLEQTVLTATHRIQSAITAQRDR
jgi:hypothetical protein